MKGVNYIIFWGKVKENLPQISQKTQIFLDRITGFLDADFAENADRFSVSFVFSVKFSPKASFVAKLCHRPQGHINGLLMKLTK
jgi:hypothetical protein